MSWHQVRAEFEALLEQPAERREQRLRELATTDRRLAEQVRDLLRQDAGAGAFLERAAAAPPPSPGLATGQQFGRFRLVRPLGSGGMGSVWEAEQADPHRRVALKLLVRGARSAEERWRFRHEVQVLAGLQHPAIATFFEAGSDDFGGSEVAWLAMELVDGARDVLTWADERQLGLAARLALFDRLCDAVASGHRRGVLHRDLKPSNVLVGGDGQLKLIDFGIARAVGEDAADGMRTRTGEIVGTLQYMAPEQLRGEHDAVGTASDVYALGVLLYHLVCGRAPFDFAGRSFAAIASLALEQEPLPPRRARPGLPVDLHWILLAALEKDPARRYATVDALRADLDRFRAHEPVLARPAGLLYRAHKFVRRNRVAVAIAIALVSGLGVAGIGLWRGAEQAREGERLANLGRQTAERGERAARRASELSQEVLRVTVGLFEGIDETQHSKDVTVHELLDAAVIDERATRAPQVEQAVREVRGDAYARVGRYHEARREYERAVDLQAAVLQAAAGDEDDRAPAVGHGHVLAARLGVALVRTGERERGDAMLRDAVEAVVEQGSDTQHLRVLYTFCQYLGQENQDAELVERARALRELAARVGSPGERLFADRWLAKGLGALQRHDEARTVALSAWEQAQAYHGTGHRNTCAAHASYVTVLQEAGDLDAAERAYPALIEEVRAVYGPTHENLLTTLNNQAHLLFSRGRRDEALAALRAIVAVHEARGGMTLEHLQARHNLGQVLNMMARFGEAEPLLRAAAEASRQLLGPDDVDGAKMRFNHGACLAWSKRFAEAEPILLAEYTTMVRLLPAEHEVLTKSRRTIADAYRVNGKPEAAAEWRAK